VKGADLIQVGNNVIIERAQTGGPGAVNLSPERVYELGNYVGLATIFDIPDLTFGLDSLDATCQFEAIIAGVTYTGRTTTGGITTTVASPDVHDTNGAFTQFDVGTNAVIPGAGTAGATLTSTILTVTDSTHIILADDAETAITGAGTATYGGMVDGDSINMAASLPLDILDQIKQGVSAPNPFEVEGSAVVPYLTLESLSYSFGVKDNAKQTASLRGDSLFYNPAASSAYRQVAAGTGTGGQTVTLANTAYPYNGAVLDGTKYVLAARLASGQRLFYGTDYTEVATGGGDAKSVVVTFVAPIPTTDHVIVIYASDVVASYPQDVATPVTNITPAAIRGPSIEVFVAGTSLSDRWTSVQTVTLDWKVTLDQDREFSNTQLVDQDFFVPDVAGTVVIKPRNYADFYKKLAATAGLATLNEVGGAVTTTPLTLAIVLHSPVDNTILKTLYVPDARFTLPGFSGQVQQKLSMTFPWSSDTGVYTVYKGQMPGGPE